MSECRWKTHCNNVFTTSNEQQSIGLVHWNWLSALPLEGHAMVIIMELINPVAVSAKTVYLIEQVNLLKRIAENPFRQEHLQKTNYHKTLVVRFRSTTNI